MEYFNDCGLRHLADVLDDKLGDLDKVAYTLAAILPLTELTHEKGKLVAFISIAELLSYTKSAEAAMETLVTGGVGLWKMQGQRRVGVIVGSSVSGLKIDLLVKKREIPKKAKFTASKVARSSEAQKALSIDLVEECGETITALNEMHDRYKDFCQKFKITNAQHKSEKLIKDYIEAASIGRVNSTVLLNYLAGVNAMVLDELAIENLLQPKNAVMANKVLAKATPKELFSIVPDFCLHYPTIAKGSYTDATIFTLFYNISKYKQRSGKVLKTKKFKSNDTL